MKIILSILFCSACYTFSNAQTTGIYGSWVLQKVHESQWKSGIMAEQEYTTTSSMVGLTPKAYSKLTVSGTELYCQSAGSQKMRKIADYTVDENGTLVIHDSKVAEYSYYLPDANTLVLTTKAAVVSKGEDIAIEQTLTYKRDSDK